MDQFFHKVEIMDSEIVHEEMYYFRKFYELHQAVLTSFGHEGDDNCKEFVFTIDKLESVQYELTDILYGQRQDQCSAFVYSKLIEFGKMYKEVYDILSKGGTVIYYAGY